MANARDFKTPITVNGRDIVMEDDIVFLLAAIYDKLDELYSLLYEVGRPKGPGVRHVGK